MYTDKGLILATAEAVANQGASPGGLGEASVNLAYDLATSHDVAGVVISDPSVSDLELEIQVDTNFTAAEPTVSNVNVTFELVSLPIALSLLSDGSGGASDGKRTHKAGAVLTHADDTVTITGHGLSAGTPIYFSAKATTSGVSTNKTYYVSANALAANTFKLALTRAVALDSAGAIVAMGTGNGTATVEFHPFVHASTGPIALPFLQAGARFVAKVSPFAVDTTTSSAAQVAGDTPQPYGSGKGRDSTYPGALPVCGRYLALLVRSDGASGTAGRYTANLGVNMQSGQRHYPTASVIA